MLFGKLISELSDACSVDLVRAGDMPDIRDVAFIDGRQTIYEDDVVYFGSERSLADSGTLPPQCIVSEYTGTLNFEDVRCFAVVPEDGLFAAFNRARKIVDSSTGHGLYEELTQIADKTHDVDAVLNAAATKLGNSLVFSDNEYRIISSSTSIPVVDRLWSMYISQGYCNYDFVMAAAQMESVRKASYTADAIEVTCSESPYRKLSSKVLHGGVQIGFVLMIASATPVLLAHFDMLRSVSQALAYTISNYATYLFQGIDRYQQLLYSLLIGAEPEDLAPQLSALSFPQHMAAVCIRQTRYLGQKHLKSSVGEGLNRVFPGARSACYMGCIAAILPLGSRIELAQSDLDTLSEFAESQFVKIGISHAFSLIENFSSHYAQASKALDLAQRLGHTDSIVQFKDYQVQDLLSRTDGTADLGLYCHPLLGLLRQYDHKNGTELYKTLRCFEETGGNLKNTAELLFIHRNSLVYRIRRIEEIGTIDLNDVNTKFILKLSLEIDRYLGLDS
jgi:hypothetical protein